MKKLISLLLAAVMVLALCVPAMAWEWDKHSDGIVCASLDSAKAGDTINLIGDNIYDSYSWMYVDKVIYIDKPNITINFENYYFSDSGCDDYYIYVDADNVTLNFKNCYFSTDTSDEKYSVIYVNGEHCVINGNGSTEFKYCYSGAKYGGAIYVDGNGCEIKDCKFRNCSATGYGGAIYVEGKGCFIHDSQFEQCNSYDGGAICVNHHDCHIKNCTFTDCHAEDYGGAVYVCSYTYGFVASHCTFNNVSAYYGQYISGAQDAEVFDCSPCWGVEDYYPWCKFATSDPIGLTFGSGSTWIIGIGGVVILGGLAAILVANKKKKLADANVETAAETTEKAEE